MKAMRPAVRRTLAGVGAVALAFGSALTMTTAANAAVGPDQPGKPAGGSLTIHKIDGAQGAAGDGTVITPAPTGTPLNNVNFTIWQLGKDVSGSCVALDLTKTADWASVPVPADGVPATLDAVKAAGFCVVDPGAGTAGTPGKVVTTSGQGAVTFTPAAGVFGLYYVQETDSSGATNATTGDPVTVVSEAAPFYVTIPLANAGDWIYDVHAYPKNQTLDEPSKTVNSTGSQTGLKVGDTVEYTITQTVPALNAGETYTTASIYDVLKADELKYDSTVSVTLGGTALDAADYDIITSPEVSWVLTNTGRAKLVAGQTLEVKFKAKVLKVTETGEIGNPGSNGETPGYGSEFNGTKIPGGPTPYTYWGQLIVKKVDNSTPAKPLKDAEFQVFPRTGDTCATAVPTGTPVSTGISGADGLVVWNASTPASSLLGLFVANSNDGPLTDASKFYCVYETKVPAGYTGQPVYEAEIEPGTTAAHTWDAVNTQRDTPNLPLTGGAGTAAMAIGGLLLVAAGAAAIVVTRRRNADVG